MSVLRATAGPRCIGGGSAVDAVESSRGRDRSASSRIGAALATPRPLTLAADAGRYFFASAGFGQHLVDQAELLGLAGA